MSSTKISSVIVPEVFNPYIIEETTRLDAFVQAGIVVNDPDLDKLALSGGIMINMPFWTDLDGDSEELSDSKSLTVGGITAKKDIARLHMRGKAWGANDLAKALSGDDPMGVIASKVAKYWVGERSKMLFASLKGISAAIPGNVHDISAATGADSVIGVATVLDAKQKLGDNASKLTGIAMHSAVFTKLQKNNEIQFVADSDTKVAIPFYLGYRVIVDDQCPTVGGVYTTYLFGEGAFGLGNGAAPVPTETDRDSLLGEDILINRQHFLLHPRGIKWTEASVADETPTYAEAGTATNWEQAYTTKNIRIVIFKHKIA
jgi:hypothetical protein